MSKAVVVFSFLEPEEDSNKIGHIVVEAKKLFIDMSDVQIHLAIKEAADEILSVFDEDANTPRRYMDPEESVILKYFTYSHLTNEKLRDTSKLFCDLAFLLEETLPRGPEKSTALRKLLEAKDAAVRSALDV